MEERLECIYLVYSIIIYGQLPQRGIIFQEIPHQLFFIFASILRNCSFFRQTALNLNSFAEHFQWLLAVCKACSISLWNLLSSLPVKTIEIVSLAEYDSSANLTISAFHEYLLGLVFEISIAACRNPGSLHQPPFGSVLDVNKFSSSRVYNCSVGPGVANNVLSKSYMCNFVIACSGTSKGTAQLASATIPFSEHTVIATSAGHLPFPSKFFKFFHYTRLGYADKQHI